MASAVWKGTLEFGLVNIPIGLYPAESSEEFELHMLDKRDMAPVGYNLINKTTGETITRSHVVKGYEYEEGRFVVLTEEELKSANAEATQTVEIVGFVAADAIPMPYFDRPYYLAPEKKGQKTYVLFREALKKAKKVGIARVVLRTRQHMAAVYPQDNVIVLQLLRYEDEFRDVEGLGIPAPSAKTATVGAKEIALAVELIGKMAEPWRPAAYHDEYHDQLMAFIKRKAKTGRGSGAAPRVDKSSGNGKVLDLMALLKRSVAEGKHARKPKAAAPRAATRARKTTPGRRSA